MRYSTKVKVASVSNVLSSIACIAGIPLFFLGLPVVTIICAVISIIDSIMQVKYGDQNSLTTEKLTIVIGIVVGLISKCGIINAIAVTMCIGNTLLLIVGWIFALVAVSSNDNKLSKKRTAPSVYVNKAPSIPLRDFRKEDQHVKAEPSKEELKLTALYEELKSINDSIRSIQCEELLKNNITLGELEKQKQVVLSQIRELESQ